MPISKILPDGKVRIYNDKTGEVKDVAPEQLASFNPRLVGDYQKMLNDRETVGETVKNIQAGIGTPPTGTGDMDVAINSQLRSLGYKPESEEEKKVKTQNTTVESDVDLFEKNFLEAGLRGKVLGFVPSGTGLSPESADFDAQREALAYSLATTLFGQKGQGASNKDIEKIGRMLPSRRDNDVEAKNKMQNIRQMLASRTGNAPKDTSIKPSDGGGLVKKAVDLVIGASKNVAQDVGAGIATNQEMPALQESQDNLFQMAQRAEAKALETKDPEQKRRLLKVASDAYAKLGVQGKDIEESFSEDVQENPLVRGIAAGSEITAAAELPSMIKGGINMVRNAPDVINSAKQLPDMVKKGTKLLTKRGAAEASTEAAEAAAKSGARMHWNDVQKQISTKVYDTLGKNKEITKSLQKILAENTPAGIESIPKSLQKDPSQLLKWRRQIQARGGSNLLKKAFGGGDIDDKVLALARGELTQMVHKLAPGTVTPDRAYRLYMTLKGDVPAWIARAAVAYVVGAVGKGVIGGVVGNVTNNAVNP